MNSGASAPTADRASTGKLPILQAVQLTDCLATLVLSDGRTIQIPEPDDERILQLWKAIGLPVKSEEPAVDGPDEYGRGPQRCERCG